MIKINRGSKRLVSEAITSNSVIPLEDGQSGKVPEPNQGTILSDREKGLESRVKLKSLNQINI
jgi:hypothetical protein